MSITALLDIHALDCGSVRNATLQLAAGECLGLMGPSGAGKTRLLRAIADLDPNRGEIRLRGEERVRIPPHHWRQRVGYLPAESHWWGDSVGEHMAAATPATLAALGLGADVLDWEVARLSSGERQRLALVRLLAQRPEVLLLDEPTANLDPANAARMEACLRVRRKAGVGLIWVSHDEVQLRRVAQRALRVIDGRLEPLAWT